MRARRNAGTAAGSSASATRLATQLRNNYDKGTAGVFNGTVGVVTAMSTEDHTLTVRTDEDEQVDYGFDELDELAHAYAVTIHRSQGSEYPAVVIPLTTSSWMMLQRQPALHRRHPGQETSRAGRIPPRPGRRRPHQGHRPPPHRPRPPPAPTPPARRLNRHSTEPARHCNTPRHRHRCHIDGVHLAGRDTAKS